MTPNHEAALVLRSIRHGESSRILTLLCRQIGKVAVIAKGARKGKHGGGALSPPSLIEAVIYMKTSREVQTLGSVHSIHNYNVIKNDLTRSAYAAAILELANRASTEEEGNPELFELILETLNELDIETGKPKITFWRFNLQLMRVSGISFDVNICPICGTSEYKVNTHNRVSHADGGVCCTNCRPSNGEVSTISGETLSILRQLVNGSIMLQTRLKPSKLAQDEISRLLENYLRYHIPGLGKLPALQMLKNFDTK
ncbi:DNA repair protein RecO [Calditrichota bacterium]